MTLSASAGPSTTTQGLRLGMSYGDRLMWMSDAQLAAALDDAVTLGAHWVRADLSWANIQPEGPQDFRWPLFDRVVAAAAARRLTLLPILTYTPAWARSRGCPEPTCAPRDAAAFAGFARAAAARYGPRGVHTWEIWNEPNTVAFWKPAPSASAYASLLKATAQQLKAADSGAQVLLGGLAAVTTAGGNISAAEFLDAACARGANTVVNAIAYHPYTYPFLASARTSFSTAWEKMSTTTQRSLRDVLRARGTPGMPIWITEYGAPTNGPGTASDGTGAVPASTTHVTEQRQAAIAADSVRTATLDPYVAALVWYSDRDLSLTDRSTSENFYGLRRADGTAKPAFAALRNAIATNPARSAALKDAAAGAS